MRAFAIVQARMGSSRFPGKSMAEIDGYPILWYLFRQLDYCRLLDRRILATSDQTLDDVLADYATKQGWDVFRGSESDVLARYNGAAKAFGAEPDTVIVRVTGDDIWPDPYLIDAAINLHKAFAGLIDCVFTPDSSSLPYGVYVESFNFDTLSRATQEASDPADREHVAPFIRRNHEKFPRLEIGINRSFPAVPLSIDTPDDLERNALMLRHLEATGTPPFGLADILAAADHLEESF